MEGTYHPIVIRDRVVGNEHLINLARYRVVSTKTQVELVELISVQFGGFFNPDIIGIDRLDFLRVVKSDKCDNTAIIRILDCVFRFIQPFRGWNSPDGKFFYY